MNSSEKQTYIENVKSKYEKKEECRLERIKELDRKATVPAMIIAYCLGIAGTLVFGAGMCFAMGVIGKSVVLGVLLGLAGAFTVAVNYPVYKKNIEKGKNKYRKEILDLLDKI